MYGFLHIFQRNLVGQIGVFVRLILAHVPYVWHPVHTLYIVHKVPHVRLFCFFLSIVNNEFLQMDFWFLFFFCFPFSHLCFCEFLFPGVAYVILRNIHFLFYCDNNFLCLGLCCLCISLFTSTCVHSAQCEYSLVAPSVSCLSEWVS